MTFLLLKYFAQSHTIYSKNNYQNLSSVKSFQLLWEKKIIPISDNHPEIGNCRLQSNSNFLAKLSLIRHAEDCSAVWKR